jgi:hypothetical protein
MAGLTRKQYVIQVTQQLVENPKACLAGHGLNGAILNMIASRPDILGKLAIFCYSTVNNKKGAKGLKKSNAFKISGYKTFADFNTNARTDVENFMSGLSPEDAENFTNENNILTFIILADKQTGNVEADIANLQSVAVPFNSSVKKEYKIPGGIYVTIMWGNSIILAKEETKAEVKETVNKRIVARRNPAKLKNELTNKAKSKLARLKIDQSKLKANANKTAAELQQFAEIGKIVGAPENAKPGEVIGAMKAFTNETKIYLRSLSKEDLKLYKDAVAYKKAGKLNLMYNLLAEVSPENVDKVTQIVRDGNLTTADGVLEARRKAFRQKIAEITEKNAELLVAAENAPNAKTRGNINFKIRANIEQIKLLKAKMNLHKNLTITNIKNKAKLLAETNAAIEANRLKGLSIQDSLNSAIAALPVDAQQKQQIKQQVVEQLATGTPLQYAVQQAIQSQPIPEVNAEITDFEDEIATTIEEEDQLVNDVFGNRDEETADIASSLANSSTISDILASL